MTGLLEHSTTDKEAACTTNTDTAQTQLSQSERSTLGWTERTWVIISQQLTSNHVLCCRTLGRPVVVRASVSTTQVQPGLALTPEAQALFKVLPLQPT
jgi:hypothetical protein